MKVVFDTNVIIAGFLTTTGIPQQIFSKCLKCHDVVLSEFILEKVRRKLTGKLGIPIDRTEKAVGFLKKRAAIVNAPNNPAIHFSDRKDIPILSLAVSVGAHYLISGDKKVLALKKIGNTLILSPREAFEIL